MPVSDKIARFAPLKQPGHGTFTLLHFNGLQSLGGYQAGIELIVVRRNEEPLADWVSPQADGFLRIQPKNCRQRALDFCFDVGPEVVNPMAFDNSGDYLLKVKDQRGVYQTFTVAIQGMPRPSSNFGPKPQPRPSFKAQGPNGAYMSPEERLRAAQEGTGLGPDSNKASASSFTAAAAGEPVTPAERQARANATQQAAMDAAANREIKTQAAGTLIKVIGIACVILLLLGAAYFLKDLIFNDLEGTSPSPVAQSQSQEEQSPAKAEETPQLEENAGEKLSLGTAVGGLVSSNPVCRIDGAKGDDRTIINNCLASNPSNEDLRGMLAESLRLNRCEIALRILRTKGRAADGGLYAYVYAMYADPRSKFASQCITKSDADAQYWAQRVQNDQTFNLQEAQDFMQQLPSGAAQPQQQSQGLQGNGVARAVTGAGGGRGIAN